MKKFIRLAVCLGLFCVSFSALAQITENQETKTKFLNDLQISEEQMAEYGEKIASLYKGMGSRVPQKMLAKVQEKMKNGDAPPSQQDAAKLSLEVVGDEMLAMRKDVNDEAVNVFSDEKYQKMQLRYFQIHESVAEQLQKSDSQELILDGFGTSMLQFMMGLPNLLEFSPEQEEEINKLQTETFQKTSLTMAEGVEKMLKENPKKFAEIHKIAQQMMKTEDDEEREKLAKQIQEFSNEIIKPLIPQLKKIILDGHDSFLRVLTDAQKAKLKQILADTPDYLKDAIAKAVKSENSGLDALNSWVPGTGVPGVNPNREQRSPRPRENERRVPGAN